ncbi:hypothetical protein EDM21_09390 [Paenibacillus sp. N10]|uniref:Uncharacterized protein n=1 Tax=Paenibacillus lutrae TaxID=2078573 RepID=A0A7X3FHK1_9BACL|nr:hypothetical protein [Paenibacillus lutrae]
MLIICSLLSNISLSQNYMKSLIPEANDGIGISNRISYWIIGEGNWSQERFKMLYEQSVLITIILLLTYVFTLVFEKFKKTS